MMWQSLLSRTVLIRKLQLDWPCQFASQDKAEPVLVKAMPAMPMPPSTRLPPFFANMDPTAAKTLSSLKGDEFLDGIREYTRAVAERSCKARPMEPQKSRPLIRLTPRNSKEKPDQPNPAERVQPADAAEKKEDKVQKTETPPAARAAPPQKPEAPPSSAPSRPARRPFPPPRGFRCGAVVGI